MPKKLKNVLLSILLITLLITCVILQYHMHTLKQEENKKNIENAIEVEKLRKENEALRKSNENYQKHFRRY